MKTVSKRKWLKLLAFIPLVGFPLAAWARSGMVLEQDTKSDFPSVEEYMKKIMENFPYEIITVSGEKALEEWQRQKDKGTHWPIIIGSKESSSLIFDQFTPEVYSNGSFKDFDNSVTTTAQTIAQAAQLVFPKDLKNWEGATPSEDLLAPKGNWPSNPAIFESGPTITREVISNKTLESVQIVLLPTKNCWEVPALLNWGNWNACPPAKYHVAALKKWHELYGAELVCLSGDTLEVRLKKRPESRSAAMKLAEELYFYCPDLIDQGTGTKSNLAAALLESDWWSFWWD